MRPCLTEGNETATVLILQEADDSRTMLSILLTDFWSKFSGRYLAILLSVFDHQKKTTIGVAGQLSGSWNTVLRFNKQQQVKQIR
ncbi:hypothetical protein [Peribacillus sp. TH27]|uniref:hypothetical protein n=1 Tax=Peribacillus sp. TH27 TaxID=2798484 RepID=UPI0019148FB9|nr:hypothetical protein [Peribacillus sp. TH27]MBK5458138.1 hypothetical protein [Peribacillus sp. TH27]